MGGALADAQERVHAEGLHLLDAEDLDAAAVGLEPARDLRHLLRIEVVRRTVGERRPDIRRPRRGSSRGRASPRAGPPTRTSSSTDAQHGLGVPDAAVDARGTVGSLQGADRGRAVAIGVLAVAQPERQRRRASSLEAARGGRADPAGTPGPAAAPAPLTIRIRFAPMPPPRRGRCRSRGARIRPSHRAADRTPGAASSSARSGGNSRSSR